MKKTLYSMCAAFCLAAVLTVPASALQYTVGAPDDYLFGRPTSDDTIYVTTDEPANTDRSKSAARIPPAFGSPTSYTLNAGELLTPNLVNQNSTTGTVAGGGVTVMPPKQLLPGSYENFHDRASSHRWILSLIFYLYYTVFN